MKPATLCRALVCCLLPIAAAHAADTLNTRFGKLEVVRSSADSTPDALRLKGRIIHRNEMFYLNLYQRFELGREDVVLLGANCGGSGCLNDDLSLLVLAPGHSPRVLSDPAFQSNDGTVKAASDGRQVSVELGFENGKAKRALYDGQRLQITSVPLGRVALPAGECRWVYDYAAQGCAEAAKSDPQCRDPQATFPGVTYRGLAAVANHPGFSSGRFDKLCRQICQRRQVVSYAQFGQTVCTP